MDSPLFSTIFLMGPVKQIKSMFEKKRIVATLIFLAAMGMTLFSALYVCAYLEVRDLSSHNSKYKSTYDYVNVGFIT